MGSDSFSQKTLSDESINPGLVCAHVHSIVDSEDPDIHVLDGWMPATKNTPSMHHPQRQNVTTSMVGLKNGHIHKNLTQNGEPQKSSWGVQKKKKKKRLRYSFWLLSALFYETNYVLIYLIYPAVWLIVGAPL